MKKIALVLICALYALNGSAQYFTLTPNGMVNSADIEKRYVVLEFEGKTQAELFGKARSYFVSTYNSAKDVMSVSEPETISALAAFTSKSVVVNYKYVLTFKDGRIKVDFIVGDMRPEDITANWKASLVRQDILSVGVFDKKGKPLSRQMPAKIDIEAQANNLTKGLVDAINGKTDETDW